MQYFLDSDICIYALKGTYPHLAHHLRNHDRADIKIAAIVRAELLLGVLKSRNPSRTGDAVQRFLAPFDVVPFGAAAAEHYARVRFDLETTGTPIGPNDMVLAATVLAQRGCLVTHNTKEFDRLEGLKTEDWTT